MLAIERLEEVLEDQPAGKIEKRSVAWKSILELLTDAWPHLCGGDDQSTTADKLYRLEDLHCPPHC